MIGLDVAVTPGRPALRVTGLTKSFGSQKVLDDISLEIRNGEIVALLGQNGSGKSTLVKVMAGVHLADHGVVETAGAEGADGGALHFIHQDLGLIESLSTIENLSLCSDDTTPLLAPYRRRAARARAEELVSRFGVRFDVTVPIGRLTPAQRSIVAIARAMSGWGEEDNVLVLDEPTASLQGEEVNLLLDAVREVARQGAAILFISHRLDEVVALADRVIVLRDGVKVHDTEVGDLGVAALAQMITGVENEPSTGERGRRSGMQAPSVLSVRGLVGGGVRGLDLDLRQGEVIGVAGSLGSGRENLAGVLFGALPIEQGDLLMDGRRSPRNPSAAMAAGIALVPSDRHARGGVMHHSVRENVVLPRLRPLAWLGLHLVRARERAEAHDWARRIELRPLEPERSMHLLSGGNQQKVVVARALRVTPRVLLVEEPTHGVDVGAAEAVRSLIVGAAEAGAAVLVTSSDNADLIRMCSEVVVLRDGAPVARLTGADISDHRLTLECLGADVNFGVGATSAFSAGPDQELNLHVSS